MKGVVCPGHDQVEIGDNFCICESKNEQLHICYKLLNGNIVCHQLSQEEEDNLWVLLDLRKPLHEEGA